MALVPFGFDGSLNEAQFSKLMALAGVQYSVGSPTEFRVTSVTAERAVSVAAGYAYAVGVAAEAGVAEKVILTTPSAGQWHLIVVRRDWLNNTATLVAVAGATTSSTTPTVKPTTLPTLEKTPGVRDDQVIAWVWVNATTTNTLIFDMRALSISYLLADMQAQISAFTVMWGNIGDKPTTFPPIIGSGAAQAVAGNDSRLSNARPPTPHSHDASQVLVGSESSFLYNGRTFVAQTDSRLTNARPPTAHNHDSSNIFVGNQYLTNYLAATYAPKAHKHTVADITGLVVQQAQPTGVPVNTIWLW